MYTPTPSASGNAPGAGGDWSAIDVDLIVGPRGRAAIVEVAAQRPLRVRFVCGGKNFKTLEAARVFARQVVGLNGPEEA
jgi:hypothetical protein